METFKKRQKALARKEKQQKKAARRMEKRHEKENKPQPGQHTPGLNQGDLTHTDLIESGI
jgi:hypothetical protein